MNMNSWTLDKEKYRCLAAAIEPAACVTTKDSTWWKVLWGLGVTLTLGIFAAAMPLRRFLEDFGTTVGFWLGFPRRLTEIAIRFLRHECRHVTQFVWFGWAFPILGWFFGRKVRALAGVIPMGITYALLPLPVGFALGRYLLEADAEETSWRAGLKDGTLNEYDVKERALTFGALLSGKAYLWAWPWAVSGLTKRANRAIAETVRSGRLG
jgi:hypothetical protein